jgi:hypothetical protein
MLDWYRIFAREIDKAISRKWDSIYIVIDNHGVLCESTYSDEIIPIEASYAPLRIMEEHFPMIKKIIWSSTSEPQLSNIIARFTDHGVSFVAINENPEVSGDNFKGKLYFNILLDDKAGFDPDVDWADIEKYGLLAVQERYDKWQEVSIAKTIEGEIK